MYYGRAGNTLTVWVGDRQEEYMREETGDEVVLIKDQAGRVIGFEKPNYTIADSDSWRVAFETVAA